MVHKKPAHFCIFIQEQDSWTDRDKVEIEKLVLRASIILFQGIDDPDWMAQPKYQLFWDLFDPTETRQNQCKICQLLLPLFVQKQQKHSGMIRFSHSEFYFERLGAFIESLLAIKKIKKIYLLLLDEQGPHEPSIEKLCQKEKKITYHTVIEYIHQEKVEFATLYEILKEYY